MNPKSSNSTDMLNALEHIKPVKVRETLFDEINQKISEQKIIPLYKLRAAAAILLCVVSVELFIGAQSSSEFSSANTEQLVPLTSNALYHD